jgi:hypothetical protein
MHRFGFFATGEKYTIYTVCIDRTIIKAVYFPTGRIVICDMWSLCHLEINLAVFVLYGAATIIYFCVLEFTAGESRMELTDNDNWRIWSSSSSWLMIPCTHQILWFELGVGTVGLGKACTVPDVSGKLGTIFSYFDFLSFFFTKRAYSL